MSTPLKYVAKYAYIWPTGISFSSITNITTKSEYILYKYKNCLFYKVIIFYKNLSWKPVRLWVISRGSFNIFWSAWIHINPDNLFASLWYNSLYFCRLWNITREWHVTKYEDRCPRVFWCFWRPRPYSVWRETLEISAATWQGKMKEVFYIVKLWP